MSLFNRNQGQSETKRAGRTRLDTLTVPPKLHDIRMLLVEAQRNKGALCELPIKTATGMFVLSCQDDHLSAEPCWTLYEGEGVKQLWSYMNNDLDMITDIVNMSVVEKKDGSPGDLQAAISDVTSVLSNAVQAQTENKPWGQFAGQNQSSSGSSWPTAQPEVTPFATPEPTPFAAPASAPFAAPASTPFATPASTPFAPEAQWPTAPQMQPQPPVQQPFSTPAPQGWPTSQPPSQWPAQNMPEMAPQAMPTPSPMPAPSAVPAPAMADPAPSPWINKPAPASVGGGSMLAFLTLLDRKKNITIGELLFEKDVPPACADSAMRLQEMICKSEITEPAAIEALKLAAQRGTGIVDESVLGEIRQRSNAAAGSSRAAAQLLKDAGLITESDMTTAIDQSQGKDIGEILISNGKTDKLIFDGALKCVELIGDGKIRSDQGIIALHYCARARAPIEQAFDDLSISV